MLPHSPIRLLLADNHAVSRMGLSAILSLDLGLQIVAEAEDGAGTLEQYRLHLPDVVLMDLKIPEPEGITTLIRLKQDFPEAKVLILATT
ncbi:response regulator transcription factor, partial [bacterium]|nr:response regulator transcription factor [bacterium]